MAIVISLFIGIILGWFAKALLSSKISNVFPKGKYDIELNERDKWNIRNEPIQLLNGQLLFRNLDERLTAVNIENISKLTITKHN